MKRKQGISLIVLVITIIVIVVLATAVILSIANNNPIENAQKAVFLNDIKAMEEDYALRKMTNDLNGEKKSITIADLTDNEEYQNKLMIKDGKIVLIQNEATEKEIEWANESEIDVLEIAYLKAASSDNTFLGIEDRYEITKVIFEDTTENAPSEVVDVSEAGDNSIIGWLDGTEVHIASETEIFANPNSSKMFYKMENLTEIGNLTLLNTSKVTDVSQMFEQCYRIKDLDLSGFNTSNVTDMSKMFESCYILTDLDLSGFDTSNVTNMAGMFCETSVVRLDLSSFDTSNVTDMSMMFGSCYILTDLDLSGFDTSNVTNMARMFAECGRLTSLDLSGFDTSKVTNMSGMFYRCASLNTLDVGNFNTSNVTDMSMMFEYCDILTDLDLSGFDTSNVTNMAGMFCETSVVRLDLSSFDTSNVTDMSSMFVWSSNLKTIYISEKFITTKVLDSSTMFKNCSSLVGGAGTTYDSNHTDKEYARIDGGTAAPGYFTLKNIE